jgi:hypothetical protein
MIKFEAGMKVRALVDFSCMTDGQVLEVKVEKVDDDLLLYVDCARGKHYVHNLCEPDFEEVK